MGLQVFDTYVEGSKGTIHIDILMPEGKSKDEAIECGKKFLKSIGEENAKLTTEECRFCHITIPSEDQQKDIDAQGYSIIKMSGC